MSLKEKKIYIYIYIKQELQKRDTNQSNTHRKKRIRPQKPSNAITASMNAAVDKSTYSHHPRMCQSAALQAGWEEEGPELICSLGNQGKI